MTAVTDCTEGQLPWGCSRALAHNALCLGIAENEGRLFRQAARLFSRSLPFCPWPFPIGRNAKQRTLPQNLRRGHENQRLFPTVSLAREL